MIGIGPLEILVILVVALVVIGPEKMPELARALARLMRDLRGAMDEVRGHFEDLTKEDFLGTKEIDDYYRNTIKDVKESMEAPDEVKEVSKDISNEITDSMQLIERPEDKAEASEEAEVSAETKEEEQEKHEPPAQPSP